MYCFSKLGVKRAILIKTTIPANRSVCFFDPYIQHVSTTQKKQIKKKKNYKHLKKMSFIISIQFAYSHLSFLSLQSEFHEKRYQTHKNEISHFAIEMLSLPSNHIKACVSKNKLSTVYYFYKKNRPYSDLWDLKKCAFLLAAKFSEVSSCHSTSII